MRYRCATHNVILEADGSERSIRLPSGSFVFPSSCCLLTARHVEPGNYGACVIEAV